MSSRKRDVAPWLAMTLALALVAAACGSGSGGTSFDTLPGQTTQAPTPDADDGDAAPEPADAPVDAPDEEATEPDEGADQTADEDEAAAEEAPAAAGPVAPIENLFPDVDVIDLSSGSSVNLASSLGGGDKATLLWFWAPH